MSNKERELYDKFVDVLNAKLEGDITPKELDIVMNFLKNNNIQASNEHQGLSKLTNNAMNLPFEDEEELPPIKRVK